MIAGILKLIVNLKNSNMKWFILLAVCMGCIGGGIALIEYDWFAAGGWFLSAYWAFYCFYKELEAEKRDSSITDNN